MNKEILAAIQDGLPLVPRPYAEVAERVGVSEAEVIAVVKEALQAGVIRRLGYVVRHHELGYGQNAMCVWDIPEERVAEIGGRMAREPGVTLCYRRRRSLPRWPYNLYCMIHGRSREEALGHRQALVEKLDLDGYPSQVLFSLKRFKQRGARPFGAVDPSLDRFLIRELQNGLPVRARPLTDLANLTGLTETAVAERIAEYLSDGRLTRFGPMYNVEKMGGVFVLVAMRVPRERLEEVAEQVNRHREVAHNYEREHELNLWFVVATETEADSRRVLAEIERETGLRAWALPKEKEFCLELKLGLEKTERGPARTRAEETSLSDLDLLIIEATQAGLPPSRRPFDEVAKRLGETVETILERVAGLQTRGVIRRIAGVPNHYRMGFTANGMTVWDVEDSEVDRLGEKVGALPFVSHCYRRPRHPGVWRYNLFAMVHGRTREDCLAQAAEIRAVVGPALRADAVLFSRRILKKTGFRRARGTAPGPEERTNRV